MSVYITPQDELHVEHEGIALTCPQCQTLTHITATATPRFDDLSRRKPKQVGIVFRCDACGEPIFLKFTAKAYTALRIELAANYTEIERAREKFPLTYLPAEAEDMFREALNCYSAGCFNAFGAMSRRTAQSLFRELGERGKLDLFDTLQDIRALAELDDDSFSVLRAVLFGRVSRTSTVKSRESFSKSCAICCIRPSFERRACCRRWRTASTWRRSVSRRERRAHAEYSGRL